MIEAGAFTEETRKPTAAGVARALARTTGLWLQLKELIASQHAPIAEEWIFGGQKYGWSLRLKQKKRAVVYMTPCAGYFRASFALGEKAVRAAHESRLPAGALALVDAAPRFAEGRAVRLDVRRAADVRTVAALAAIKMAN